MHAQVYTSDMQKSQAHQEHVTSLQAAGFAVEWVTQSSTRELLQLVNQASHYIAHPLSPEGALLALQVRILALCMVCLCIVCGAAGESDECALQVDSLQALQWSG